jgi:hypothetical protein
MTTFITRFALGRAVHLFFARPASTAATVSSVLAKFRSGGFFSFPPGQPPALLTSRWLANSFGDPVRLKTAEPLFDL